MIISKTKRGSVSVFTPQLKKIDASVAVEFKNKLLEFVNNGETRFVLNLEHVEFIDSSGLGALVSVFKGAGPGGEIKLCAVRESVRSILELTRLDRVFAIHTSEEGAVESLE
jgi:anti-sigma B factor antagonist